MKNEEKLKKDQLEQFRTNLEAERLKKEIEALDAQAEERKTQCKFERKFFVDQINTPLLMFHGDKDGAVPWYQSIELYLSMRRHNKDVILLQYKGAGHGLKKYANKLDFTIFM